MPCSSGEEGLACMEYIFGAGILVRSYYETQVYVAAVYTQTMPIVRRWIAGGKIA